MHELGEISYVVRKSAGTEGCQISVARFQSGECLVELLSSPQLNAVIGNHT